MGNARFQLEAGNSIRVEARGAIKAGEEITVQYYRWAAVTRERGKFQQNAINRDIFQLSAGNSQAEAEAAE